MKIDKEYSTPMKRVSNTTVSHKLLTQKSKSSKTM